MASSDEDLPTVKLKSPRKKKSSKHDFFVEDASILAAQRKLEDERDSHIARMVEESFNGRSSSDAMEISIFTLPDADQLAAQREEESEKDKIINEIINNKDFANSDPEIHSCIDVIQSNEGIISIPGENPGVNMSLFDLKIPADVMSKDALDLVQQFFCDIYKNDVSENEQLISNLFNFFYDRYSEGGISKLSDSCTHFFLMCGIILDQKCRQILTVFSAGELVCKILNNLPESNDEMMNTLAQLVIKSFPDFHDRLHLSENFIIRCKPSVLNSNPKYFSTRLGKCILHKTLCSLVKFSKDSPTTCDTFNDLKKILYYGKDTNHLLPYDQYIMLKICDELLWTFVAVDSKTSKENSAKNWIINFIGSLKCNLKEQKNADFFKVKSLSSKLKLLWQMETYE